MAQAQQQPQTDAPKTHSTMRAATLFASFGYAFEGIRFLLWTQRNAKIHCGIALLAVVLGFLFGIDRYEWLAIVITILLVITLEGVNTAVEAVVDLASPARHPLAKIAKDVGAGTVLLGAIGAVVVGMIVFLPRVWALALYLLGSM